MFSFPLTFQSLKAPSLTDQAHTAASAVRKTLDDLPGIMERRRELLGRIQYADRQAAAYMAASCKGEARACRKDAKKMRAVLHELDEALMDFFKKMEAADKFIACLTTPNATATHR